MAKIIERGLGSEDDPTYFSGYIIGPIIVSKHSTKSDDEESKGENEGKGSKGLKGIDGRSPHSQK